MKIVRYILLLFAPFLLLHVASATRSFAMPIIVINNLPQAENILFESQPFFPGSTVAGNGGSAQIGYVVRKNKLEIPGISVPPNQGATYPCGSTDGNYTIVLNPNLYKKGDIITITYVSLSTDNLVCTCKGSACDVSLSLQKKRKVAAT